MSEQKQNQRLFHLFTATLFVIFAFLDKCHSTLNKNMIKFMLYKQINRLWFLINILIFLRQETCDEWTLSWQEKKFANKYVFHITVALKFYKTFICLYKNEAKLKTRCCMGWGIKRKSVLCLGKNCKITYLHIAKGNHILENLGSINIIPVKIIETEKIWL